jgi:hypothetical protein
MLHMEDSMAEQPAPDVSARVVSTWSGSAREQAVQRMFTAIAAVYDLNNTLLSFGLHYRWKRITASYVPALKTDRRSTSAPARPISHFLSSRAWGRTAGLSPRI